MRFKILLLLSVLMIGEISINAQYSLEEGLRNDFVKTLQKRRKSNSGSKPKPVLENNANAKPAEKLVEDEDTILIETRLVRQDVQVFDAKGNPILGLKPEDFIITENKEVQEIGTFSVGSSTDVPRSIVLILDYSGSQRPYIKTSVDSAKLLVDKLNPKDRLAIVSDDVELISDFSRDKEDLKKSLEKLRKKAESGKTGRSLQLSALYAAVTEMFDNEDIRPIIIFQTDCDQLFRVSTENTPIDLKRLKTSFTDKEMISTIERSRVTIYSVISGFSVLGLTPEEKVRKATPYLEQQFPKNVKEHPEDIPGYLALLTRQQNSMVNISNISGGFPSNLETPEQADGIYEKILNDINNRYLIGYYPSNQNRDGRRRNIRVEVKDHPEYIISGRKFYYAPKDEKVESK